MSIEALTRITKDNQDKQDKQNKVSGKNLAVIAAGIAGLWAWSKRNDAKDDKVREENAKQNKEQAKQGKEKAKRDRDAKRRGDTGDPTVNGFRKALRRATDSLGGFYRGIKKSFSSLIDTFSIGNLKRTVLAPFKLILPLIALTAGQALLGNLFGGGLLAAGVATGNPVLMLAGSLALLIGNLDKLIPLLQKVADPQWRQEQIDNLAKYFDPDQPNNIWNLLGSKLPSFIYAVLSSAFGKLREIIQGALGLGDNFAGNAASTVLGGVATYALARRLPFVGKMLPTTGKVLGTVAGATGLTALTKGIGSTISTAARSGISRAVLGAAGSSNSLIRGIGNFGLERLTRPDVVREVVSNTAGTATRTAGKTVASAGLKTALKKIPVIGLIAGGIFAASRAMAGDTTGAAMELASGAASTIPGVGTAASLGIDAALIARDVSIASNTARENEQTTGEVLNNVQGVVSQTQQDLQQQGAIGVRVVNPEDFGLGGSIVNAPNTTTNNSSSSISYTSSGINPLDMRYSMVGSFGGPK